MRNHPMVDYFPATGSPEVFFYSSHTTAATTIKISYNYKKKKKEAISN